MKGMIEATGIWFRNLHPDGLPSKNEILLEVGDSWRKIWDGPIPMSWIREIPLNQIDLNRVFPIDPQGQFEKEIP